MIYETIVLRKPFYQPKTKINEITLLLCLYGSALPVAGIDRVGAGAEDDRRAYGDCR